MVIRPSMWRTAPLKYCLVWLVLLAGLALAAWALLGFEQAVVRNVYAGLGAAVAAGSLLVLLGWYIRCMATSLSITDDTIILSEGLVAKRTSEVRIADVRNITVDQTVFQRIFHVGTIGISSAGQADVEISVAGLPHPDDLAEHIRNRARELTEPVGKE